MEIEISKPTPEVAAFQALFNQTDKEAILCLTKEVEELSAKLEEWQKCADGLFKHTMNYIHSTNAALYEEVKEDILVYNKLKNETQSHE
jgi:hypothetical protein